MRLLGDNRIHYGWIIVALGVLVLLSAIGLGRFSYTVILPGMKTGLGLEYDQMGYISTANFAGYLLAVSFFPPLVQRFGSRMAIATGLGLICLSLSGMGSSQGIFTAMLFYVPAGLGTAFAQIGMMTLIPRWFRTDQRGKASGLVVCGNGIGIVFVGVLIPCLNQVYGINGWRNSWFTLAVITFVILICAVLFLRNTPSELKLEPFGYTQPVAADNLQTPARVRKNSILVRLGCLYLVFGATHMIYGTFIVTSMVSEYGLTVQKAGFYWSWVGFFSLFSGVGLGMLSDRIGRKYGLALTFALQTIVYLLVGLKLGNTALICSVVLFGLTVFAIPAIVGASVGDYFGASGAAKAFSAATLFYAVGQTAGPAIAGMIAGSQGSFSTAYLLAALLTALAALFSFTLPKPTEGFLE